MNQSRKIKDFLLASGFMSLCRNISSRDTVSILRYHAITNPEDNFYASPSICLSESIFEHQIQYLSRHYNVIDLDQVSDSLRQGKKFPPRSVVLTFDDGYRDNFRAYRILKKYGVTGTFYVAAGCLGDGEPLWLFEVIYLIEHTNKTSLNINTGEREWGFQWTNRTERWQAIRKITALIKSNELKTREAIRTRLRAEMSDVTDIDEKAKMVMLSWDQAREMHNNGMTIASHTMTHINLPNASLQDAKDEIVQCKQVLESQLGAEVRHFSYPNGGNYSYYNPEIKKLVMDAGYITSTTSNNGIVRGDADLFELKRIRITPHLSEVIYQMDIERLISKA